MFISMNATRNHSLKLDPSKETRNAGSKFDSGDAEVTIDGKPRDVYGDVQCSVFGGKVLISIGPLGNPVTVKMNADLSRVDAVSLGQVDGAPLVFMDGSPRGGSASATKDGNAYKIAGTVTGVDPTQPLKPFSKPFSIAVTCP